MKIFEIGEKYYFGDLGIRNAIRGINALAEIQKWMANLVYMQLIREGFKVYVGKTDQLEIDFVGQRLVVDALVTEACKNENGLIVRPLCCARDEIQISLGTFSVAFCIDI